jgi:diguanylate cyclase (GGDEF)-like protein
VNHAFVIISAALGGLVLILATLLATSTRRSRQPADERAGDAVQSLERRVDELAEELARAVERAEEEGRRGRYLGELAGSIDMDEVLGRTLEAATRLEGVDAAVIRLDSPEGEPTVAAHGLAAEGVEPIAGPPDGTRARAIEVTYRYGEAAGSPENLISSGLAVPLEEHGDTVGYVSVYTRGRERRFAEDDVRRLEELSERAAPAIENARRYREARQLADLDALTGLHNRRYFYETLARESARAHRYNRRLGLLVFDLDDFKSVNDTIGHLGGDAVLAEAAARLREVIRSADVPCRVGGDEFAVILPESGTEHGEQLFARLEAAISARPLSHDVRLHLSAGVSELRPDDDSISFFERSDEALYRAKNAGKGQSVVA